MGTVRRASAAAFFCLALPGIALGGFPSTTVFLPSVGRIAGQSGAQFFTTIWATNLTSAPETFTFDFLRAGQANPSPASFTDTLRPGETKEYENVVETKLGLHSALGAARITSTGEVLVAERIFDQAPGADLGETEGLFFAGVPASFAVALGQSASIQGINQGGNENFRYNFALVETSGNDADVNVQVFDGNGVMLGQKAFPLSGLEQIQPNVADVVAGFSSTNARITATVTGGSGRVLLAGAQVANASQDSSGFEMSFRGDLLGGGAAGLSAVAHDASLAGNGTGASPLGIANGQVVRSLNGLHDAVTVAAGSNVTITPSGNTLTIAASGSGGGGGLASVSHDATLAGAGTLASPLGVAVPLVINASGVDAIQATSSGSGSQVQSISATLTAAGISHSAAVSGQLGASIGDDDIFGVLGTAKNGSTGVQGESDTGVGVRGVSSGSASVAGLSETSGSDTAGTLGRDGTGFASQSGFASAGVRGESASHIGVLGLTGSSGFAGVFGQDGTGSVDTASLPSSGVLGLSRTSFGVQGSSDSGNGVGGFSNNGFGVSGGSASQDGILGATFSASSDRAGVSGRDGTAFSGKIITGALSAGVRGDSDGHIGVVGFSHAFAVVGKLVGPTNVQGELGSLRESHNFAIYSFGDVKFNGTMTATGTKSFVEPHPTDATKEIRFVCLEGPESGTYFRGSGHIVGGFAKIPVPEAFRAVSDGNGLTVVATAVGGPGSIWVVRKNLDEIMLQGSSDVEFDYVVNGVRKAYRNFAAITDNASFVPDGPDDARFSLYAPEIQRRLVATGIYHADGTVNLETAKRLGWDRTWKREDDTAR